MSPGSDPRPVEDVYSSILIDIARSARIAPRVVPEDFGPGRRYRLEELIGIGRDSHVYRATDTHLSRPDVPAVVAIKIRASGAESRSEALVGRSVLHENVVRVIDHGRDEDGSSYIVQEYVDGGDLTEIAVPLPPRDAARLVLAIARGLQALHSAGNIHGDLKPSNILRTADGTPKITDFDLASATDLEPGDRGGNLAFMPPERALDSQALASPLADIYALGGLLHYFLTGKPPLGDTADEILAAHREGRCPSPDIPDQDLLAVCLHALEPDPADRYRSAEALADDLQRWLDHRPLPWTRPSLARRARLLLRRRPLPITIAALVLVALATAAALALSIANREIEAERRAVALTRAEIDELNARARRAIERFIETGLAGGPGRGPSVFAGLVWVDWLADTPILGDAGPTLARGERIRSLTALREHYHDLGQSGTLGDALSAYCLAFSFLEESNTSAARAQLIDMESSVLSLLPANDDVLRSIAGLHAVCEFIEAREAAAPDLAEREAALRRLRIEFSRLDGAHSVGQLIDLTLETPG